MVGLVELHAPGSYLIWIALGAALTGAVRAAYDLTITAQIAAFSIASAFSCFVGYFVYRHVDRRRSDGALLNQRGLLMVGARGFVCSPIVNGEGKVRLGDTVWLAEGPALEDGVPIVVHSVHGARVVVEPVTRR